MAQQFEPLPKKQTNNKDFTTWNYRDQKPKPAAETPVIDPQEVLRQECERIREEARTQGYNEGIEEAKTFIETQKKELQRWFELIQQPIKLLDDHIIQQVIQTLIWLGQHCIGIELSAHPEKIRDLLFAVRAELPMLNSHLTFAMHPDDVAWVKNQFPPDEIPGLLDILVADAELDRGDFYLKGEHSELDGRIQHRLTSIFTKYITKDNLLSLDPEQK